MTTAAERFAIAVDLHTTGVALMRQNLVRRHPGEDAEQIDARLRDWLHTRPGAEAGDGPQPAKSS